MSLVTTAAAHDGREHDRSVNHVGVPVDRIEFTCFGQRKVEPVDDRHRASQRHESDLAGAVRQNLAATPAGTMSLDWVCRAPEPGPRIFASAFSTR